MAPQPVLCPSAVNPGLFANNKQLRHVRLLRLQLCRIRDFVETCRNRGRLMQLLAPRLYLIQNTELFSLTDLAQINSGELPKYLVSKIDQLARHITVECKVSGRTNGRTTGMTTSPLPLFSFPISPHSHTHTHSLSFSPFSRPQLQLCKARAFHCELCRAPDAIYSFEIRSVVQCRGCHAFFHRGCFEKLESAASCPKCERLRYVFFFRVLIRRCDVVIDLFRGGARFLAFGFSRRPAECTQRLS